MECKKDIENLIKNIDEFKEKYVTYRTKTLRTTLVKTLDYIKRKEQECEELKEKVKELRQGWINCDKERDLQEANSGFRQRVINRYKQALPSIRNIAEEDFNHTCWEAYAGQLKQILQKIRECEVEND